MVWGRKEVQMKNKFVKMPPPMSHEEYFQRIFREIEFHEFFFKSTYEESRDLGEVCLRLIWVLVSWSESGLLT